MPDMSVSFLHELFEVDCAAGTLTWKRRPLSHFFSGKRNAGWKSANWNGRYAGKLAGSLDKNGYALVSIDRRLFGAHRLIWAMANDVWPVLEIDHVNGNRADNRIKNLREVTHVENCRNKSARSGFSSKYPGVSWIKRRQKWQAQIRIDGRLRHIGEFEDELKAASAYRVAAKAHGFTDRHTQPSIE